MRLLVALLLLLLGVVFAQPPARGDGTSGDAEQEAPPPPTSPKCKPSTLTRYARASQMSDWKVNHTGFTLTINGTYHGRIPMHYQRVGRFLRSPDLKFAVKYGEITKNHDVMLKWELQLFSFTKVNDVRTNLTGVKYRYEYDYWACIVA